MDTTESAISRAPILTKEEVQHYKQQGYVVPKWKYSDKSIETMKQLVRSLSKLILIITKNNLSAPISLREQQSQW